MESVYIREQNKEIWIDLDRNFPDKLSALEEAIRVLKREAIRVAASCGRHLSC